MTQQEFADRIGIARGNIGAYEVSKNSPSDAVISLICREFNVNEVWLRDGTGEMFQIPDDEDAALVSEILEHTDRRFYQAVLNIVRTYSQLRRSRKVLWMFLLISCLKMQKTGRINFPSGFYFV